MSALHQCWELLWMAYFRMHQWMKLRFCKKSLPFYNIGVLVSLMVKIRLQIIPERSRHVVLLTRNMHILSGAHVIQRVWPFLNQYASFQAQTLKWCSWWIRHWNKWCCESDRKQMFEGHNSALTSTAVMKYHHYCS